MSYFKPFPTRSRPRLSRLAVAVGGAITATAVVAASAVGVAHAATDSPPTPIKSDACVGKAGASETIGSKAKAFDGLLVQVNGKTVLPKDSKKHTVPVKTEGWRLDDQVKQGDTVTIIFQLKTHARLVKGLSKAEAAKVPKEGCKLYVGLASFQAPHPQLEKGDLPKQKLFRRDGAVFAPGSVHSISVEVPKCNFQIDMTIGGSSKDAYDATDHLAPGHLLTAANGGTKACSNLPTKPKPSTSPVDTDQYEVSSPTMACSAGRLGWNLKFTNNSAKAATFVVKRSSGEKLGESKVESKKTGTFKGSFDATTMTDINGSDDESNSGSSTNAKLVVEVGGKKIAQPEVSNDVNDCVQIATTAYAVCKNSGPDAQSPKPGVALTFVNGGRVKETLNVMNNGISMGSVDVPVQSASANPMTQFFAVPAGNAANVVVTGTPGKYVFNTSVLVPANICGTAATQPTGVPQTPDTSDQSEQSDDTDQQSQQTSSASETQVLGEQVTQTQLQQPQLAETGFRSAPYVTIATLLVMIGGGLLIWRQRLRRQLLGNF